jgi:hypothetical protein
LCRIVSRRSPCAAFGQSRLLSGCSVLVARRFNDIGRGAIVPGAAEAPIELGRDDLSHVLRSEPDDEIDDALLAAALVVAMACPRLLILNDATDLLRHEAHDRVDDALFIERLVAVVAVLIVAAIMAAIAVVAAAATVLVPPIAMSVA